MYSSHPRTKCVCVSAVPSLKKWEGSASDQELTKKTRQTKIWVCFCMKPSLYLPYIAGIDDTLLLIWCITYFFIVQLDDGFSSWKPMLELTNSHCGLMCAYLWSAYKYVHTTKQWELIVMEFYHCRVNYAAFAVRSFSIRKEENNNNNLVILTSFLITYWQSILEVSIIKVIISQRGRWV